MGEVDNGQGFSYTYSARDREEVEAIKRRYLPKTEDKLEQLKRLDKSVVTKSNIISITLGVAGTLIMGLGMSFCMVWTDTLMIPGIIIGLVGILTSIAAYPVYTRVLEHERKRIAADVLRLSEEIVGGL